LSVSGRAVRVVVAAAVVRLQSGVYVHGEMAKSACAHIQICEIFNAHILKKKVINLQ
jgi:hypothetical protein